MSAGSSSSGAIKPASTAAAAADRALVVAISPNNTVAVSGPLTNTELRASGVPVTGPLTNTELRASAVPVSLTSTTITGTAAVSGPLTNTELRASVVPVSLPAETTKIIGTVNVAASQSIAATQSGTWTVNIGALQSMAVNQSGTWLVGINQSLPAGGNSIGDIGTVTNLTQMGNVAISMGTGARDAGTQRVTIATNDSVPVTGPVTNAELRNTALPVSLASVPAHAVTLASTTITGTVAVSGPATNAELRNTALPVSLASTTITGSVAVSGPATNAELRNTALPVSLASVPAHAVTLASTTITGTVAVSGSFYQPTQPVSIASMPSTPVTGSFYQPTQPVSGPLTDTQLRSAAPAIYIKPTTLSGVQGNSTSGIPSNGLYIVAAGSLYSVFGFNNGPGQYIQIFDSSTTPGSGTGALVTFYVPSASNFFMEFSTPLKLNSGLAVSNSSTMNYKTLGSTDCFIGAQFSTAGA
jgi:hypothetical protein